LTKVHSTVRRLQKNGFDVPFPDFFKGIERFRKIAGDRYSKGYVLYNDHKQYTLKETRIFNPIVHGDWKRAKLEGKGKGVKGERGQVYF
jgi:hypothetical protein